MAHKKKHSWDSGFTEPLSARKEKEDARYLATVEARAAAVKRALNGQVKKDQYNKIMREWSNSASRDSLSLNTLKERIQFLESVLNENREWCPGTSEPLQLKPNPIELQATIDEMKRYVEARAKTGGLPPKTSGQSQKKRSVAQQVPEARELTDEQVAEIYERATVEILEMHGGTVKRLNKFVRSGLSVERARERLLAQGVEVQVVEAFNKIARERGLAIPEEERNAIKLYLLNPERLGLFIDTILQSK